MPDLFPNLSGEIFPNLNFGETPAVQLLSDCNTFRVPAEARTFIVPREETRFDVSAEARELEVVCA